MPSDRIFKFSIPGIMFFLTLVFFDYLFGGTLFKLFEENNIVSLIALLLSSPIVGVIFSTIAVTLLQWRFGYKIWFYPPKNEEIINYTLQENLALKDRIINEEKMSWEDKKTLKKYYPYYQVKVRRHLNDQQMSFLDRRWSTYWTSINNIAATVFSFLIAGIIGLRNCILHLSSIDVTLVHVIGLFTIVAYCYSAFVNLRNSKQDATITEHLMLEDAINAEKHKNVHIQIQKMKTKKKKNQSGL